MSLGDKKNYDKKKEDIKTDTIKQLSELNIKLVNEAKNYYNDQNHPYRMDEDKVKYGDNTEISPNYQTQYKLKSPEIYEKEIEKINKLKEEYKIELIE